MGDFPPEIRKIIRKYDDEHRAPPRKFSTMKKIVLTFGLLSGVVSAALMIREHVVHRQHRLRRGVYVGYTVIVISFLFVYFGIRSYRDNVLGGRITFGKGFQAGILITLISCVCYVGSWLVIYYNFIPDFADKYAAYMVEDKRAKRREPGRDRRARSSRART